MFLLDSSAWLTHLFGEPGVDQVTSLFDATNNEVVISALSIPEVYARVRSLGAEEHWEKTWETYSLLFSKVLPAGEAVAHQAITLRAAAKSRLPTIDGLIAATAALHGLTLVHRDPHFAAIPKDLLMQQQLPDK